MNRDEATEDPNVDYRAVEFVTDVRSFEYG